MLKKVIFNIDDIGILESIGRAAHQLLSRGPVSSASVVANGCWLPSFIENLDALKNKSIDIGLHLTLTSEWPSCRLRPILGEAVPSLLDPNGYLPRSCEELLSRALIDDVRRELFAQVTQLERLGRSPSHIDTHMLFYEAANWLLDMVFDLAFELNVPVLLYDKHSLEKARRRGLRCPDYGTLENYWYALGERRSSYIRLFNSLDSDHITALTLHPAVACPEAYACMGEAETSLRAEEYQLWFEENWPQVSATRPSEVFS